MTSINNEIALINESVNWYYIILIILIPVINPHLLGTWWKVGSERIRSLKK